MNRLKSENNGVTEATLRDDVEALRGDVAELALDARRYARQKVNGLADAVRGTASEVMGRGRDAVEGERERALGYARRHPLVSASLGLALGFALAAIVCGRGR